MEPPLTNLVVSASAILGIDDRLHRLVLESSVSCAVFLDHSGQVIRSAGDIEGRELISLGALLAGNFASAREIARLLREPSFRLSYQQGEREHVLTTLVADRCLLSVLFGASGQLGLVKVLTNQAADDLSDLLLASEHQSGNGSGQMKELKLAAGQAVDRWFSKVEGGRRG